MDGLTQPGILERTVAELHYLRLYLLRRGTRPSA